MRSEKDHIEEMIETIRWYGVEDKKILSAMRNVPRHNFIDNISLEEAYGDFPVHIGGGQTISQPYTVAYMLQLLELKKGQNVLEIGTGSGWNAALIKEIVGENGSVTTIEYDKELAEKARERISSGVEVITGDGGRGYEKNAPYDRIIVTCASPKILDSWKNQLKDNGIIVLPEGGDLQVMIKAVKKGEEFERGKYGYFRFVPLRGEF